MPTPVILDVDTGIDDAMAIMSAAAHPEIDLRAITCVDGNTSVRGVVENTLTILDLIAAPEIPVAAGATRPLIEPSRDASHVHGADGMGDLGLPPTEREARPEHAVELMRTMLMNAPEKLTIIALAPLTNVALLLRMYPRAAERIERIVFMGGSASIGNATAVAEFNIWHDPEAARIVLDSGIPLTMYGLDVFNAVTVTPAETEALRQISLDRAGQVGMGGAKHAEVTADLLEHRMIEPTTGEGVVFSRIGDAGAVLTVAEPDLVHLSRHRVQVVLDGMGRGQTMVDRRDGMGEDDAHGLGMQWPMLDVALDADHSAVADAFLRTLGFAEAIREG